MWKPKTFKMSKFLSFEQSNLQLVEIFFHKVRDGLGSVMSRH